MKVTWGERRYWFEDLHMVFILLYMHRSYPVTINAFVLKPNEKKTTINTFLLLLKSTGCASKRYTHPVFQWQCEVVLILLEDDDFVRRKQIDFLLKILMKFTYLYINYTYNNITKPRGEGKKSLSVMRKERDESEKGLSVYK